MAATFALSGLGFRAGDMVEIQEDLSVNDSSGIASYIQSPDCFHVKPGTIGKLKYVHEVGTPADRGEAFLLIESGPSKGKEIMLKYDEKQRPVIKKLSRAEARRKLKHPEAASEEEDDAQVKAVLNDMMKTHEDNSTVKCDETGARLVNPAVAPDKPLPPLPPSIHVTSPGERDPGATAPPNPGEPAKIIRFDQK